VLDGTAPDKERIGVAGLRRAPGRAHLADGGDIRARVAAMSVSCRVPAECKLSWLSLRMSIMAIDFDSVIALAEHVGRGDGTARATGVASVTGATTSGVGTAVAKGGFASAEGGLAEAVQWLTSKAGGVGNAIARVRSASAGGGLAEETVPWPSNVTGGLGTAVAGGGSTSVGGGAAVARGGSASAGGGAASAGGGAAAGSLVPIAAVTVCASGPWIGAGPNSAKSASTSAAVSGA